MVSQQIEYNIHECYDTQETLYPFKGRGLLFFLYQKFTLEVSASTRTKEEPPVEARMVPE